MKSLEQFIQEAMNEPVKYNFKVAEFAKPERKFAQMWQQTCKDIETKNKVSELYIDCGQLGELRIEIKRESGNTCEFTVSSDNLKKVCGTESNSVEQKATVADALKYVNGFIAKFNENLGN